MLRFIFLAFGFLGLGFYELSGGSDFDPETAGIALREAREEREAQRIAALPAPQRDVVEARLAASNAPGAADTARPNTIEAAALNLASFDAVIERKPLPTVKTSVDPAPVETVLDTLVDEEKLDFSAIEPSDEPVRSIVFSGNTISSAPREDANAPDIRSVKGTLVNVRSGPGTEFEVIDQVQQATRVEVLRDTGNGWVQFRALESGATGWIAAFLLDNG